MELFYIYDNNGTLEAAKRGTKSNKDVTLDVNQKTGIPLDECNWYGIEALNREDALNRFKALGIIITSREETKRTNYTLGNILAEISEHRPQ